MTFATPALLALLPVLGALFAWRRWRRPAAQPALAVNDLGLLAAAAGPSWRLRLRWAPDLLRDGENCLLVPPGNDGAMAAALDRLAGDPGLRDRLGAAARITAERHFGLASLAADVRALAERGMGAGR